MSNKIEARIDTYINQQKKVKRFVAGNGINFEYDKHDNLIVNSSNVDGVAVEGIEVMQIVPDDNLQVLYADGLATFSGMVANLRNGDSPLSVNAEIELPIEAGAGVIIDASEDNTKLVIKAEAQDVTINQPEGAVQGTLDSEQLAILLSSTQNRLILGKELYYCNDIQNSSGYLVYTHIGHDSTNNFFIKCITITLSTGGWVLDTKELA